LYRWNYPDLKDLPTTLPDQLLNNKNLFTLANPGLLHEYQFINVPNFENRGEICPSPFYYQNLAEAEYIIATFMYMCLLGHNPKKITILTTYNGQKALLKDIYKQKCSWNPIFNSPGKITTVDKYQGQQNDFVLLSLVRTNNPGHIRDVRRLIVSLSRARYGLYVFGRWNLYCDLNEMKEAFNNFSKKENDLILVPGENFGTSERKFNEDVEISKKCRVEDFRHMYRIVQELMKIRFSQK
jgi:intron-binding protein aquarius